MKLDQLQNSQKQSPLKKENRFGSGCVWDAKNKMT